MAGSTDKELVVQVALVEFERLRDEIDRRSSAQDAILNIAVTGAGAIGSIFLLQNGSGASGAEAVAAGGSQLLVLVPVLAMALGILWLDHDHTIRSIGDDIDQRLKPVIQVMTGSTALLRNEERAGAERGRFGLRVGFVAIPWALILFGIPSVGLLAAGSRVAPGLIEAFYWGQVGLYLFLYVPLWMAFIFPGLAPTGITALRRARRSVARLTRRG